MLLRKVPEKGLLKYSPPPGKDKVLGVTIVSEHAGDLLAEFVIAMKHDLGVKQDPWHYPRLPNMG